MSELTVIERSEQHTLCISEIVSTMKLGKVMGPAYQAIMDHLKKDGIECGEKDIPFTKYRNIDWDKLSKKGLFATINVMFFHKWEIDIGIPCPESATAEGRIKKMQIDPGKYIRAIHKGPYMKVGDTYDKIRSYATEQNLDLKSYSIEFYLNDPRETPPSQLETEVLVPYS